ncbi:MAG TPA: hypothetical protein VKE91_09405 [Blastocatellia bacterium]|nr:hypothetical protein [Blastocatellia bacterium]
MTGSLLFSPWGRSTHAQITQTQSARIGGNYRHHPGKDWSSEKIARESFAKHEFNRQRLQQAGRSDLLNREAAAANVSDTADVSVIQDDGSIAIPANPFNLSGRSVLFTPSDSGYTTTGGASAFDSNLGTKLDLTRSPAVNPKLASDPNVEPGDDAYIVQPLGFGFNFYASNYSSVAVSSNGYLTFRPANVSDQYFDDNSVDSGEAISSLQAALPRIAPYWHDLDARGVSTTGSRGVYIRNASDRVVITWNGILDFPNTSADNGTSTFQVVLFNDGRILFNYASLQLTSTALAGISAGGDSPTPELVDLGSPTNTVTTGVANTPLAEYFSIAPQLDEINAIKTFYTAHPGQDVYDFAYVVLDFDFDLGNNTFAFFSAIRNDVTGNGLTAFDLDPYGLTGSKRLKGFLELNDLKTQYPDYPTTRFLGSNHALSVMGQEQGHNWLAYVTSPVGPRNLLLGRDNEHWSFFFNTESALSQPAAPRSSNSEGDVWRDNGDGSFTSIGLIDGYSKLDQYLMGLRTADQVSDTFVVANAIAPVGVNRTTGPAPNIRIGGTRVPITASQIIQANGAVTPAADGTVKNYRAAVILVEPKGRQPAQATLDKLTRYRLAWESYFAQSTSYLATINTGLADPGAPRGIAMTDAAAFNTVVAPGAIAAIFGQGLTSGDTGFAQSGQPLPTSLNGVEVKVDGAPAPLFFVSPRQINFQMPLATAAITDFGSLGKVQSSTSTVEIFLNGLLIRAGAAQIAPALVGTFSASQSGQGAAAAIDALTYAPPPFNATQSNGQPNILAVFVTGLGADVTDNDGDVSAQVQVTLNGRQTTTLYAGRAPGFTGLNQINFQLPAGMAPGTYNLTISRNGFASNVTTVTIQ